MRKVNSDITVNKMCHSVALTIWMGHDDWDFVKAYWSTNGYVVLLFSPKL